MEHNKQEPPGRPPGLSPSLRGLLEMNPTIQEEQGEALHSRQWGSCQSAHTD